MQQIIDFFNNHERIQAQGAMVDWYRVAGAMALMTAKAMEDKAGEATQSPQPDLPV